jgi:hypothetical protein
MGRQEALDTIYQGLLGNNSIPVQLRSGKGLDKDTFLKIKIAIAFLKKEYKNKNEVPKKLALAFIDISSYFSFRDDFYSIEDQEVFEDAANELVQLANDLFEDDDNY